jgi:hypothetical protein
MQAQRYTEKQELIAAREAGLAAPPVPAPASAAAWEQHHYRRVAARGTYHHEGSIFIGPRSPPKVRVLSLPVFDGVAAGPRHVDLVSGCLHDLLLQRGVETGGSGLISQPGREAGFLLVTPLKLSTGEPGGVVLVNRGWIPSSMRKAAPDELFPEGECDIVVVPRPSEKASSYVVSFTRPGPGHSEARCTGSCRERGERGRETERERTRDR